MAFNCLVRGCFNIPEFAEKSLKSVYLCEDHRDLGAHKSYKMISILELARHGRESTTKIITGIHKRQIESLKLLVNREKDEMKAFMTKVKNLRENYRIELKKVREKGENLIKKLKKEEKAETEKFNRKNINRNKEELQPVGFSTSRLIQFKLDKIDSFTPGNREKEIFKNEYLNQTKSPFESNRYQKRSSFIMQTSNNREAAMHRNVEKLKKGYKKGKPEKEKIQLRNIVQKPIKEFKEEQKKPEPKKASNKAFTIEKKFIKEKHHREKSRTISEYIEPNTQMQNETILNYEKELQSKKSENRESEQIYSHRNLELYKKIPKIYFENHETLKEDPKTIKIYPDGRKFSKILSSNTSKTIFPNGMILYEFEGGIILKIEPDGTKTIIDPDYKVISDESSWSNCQVLNPILSEKQEYHDGKRLHRASMGEECVEEPVNRILKLRSQWESDNYSNWLERKTFPEEEIEKHIVKRESEESEDEYSDNFESEFEDSRFEDSDII